MNPTQTNPTIDNSSMSTGSPIPSNVQKTKTNKDPNNKKLAENMQLAFFDICDQIDREDYDVRQQQLREWKKHEKFWHGIQYLYWSETSQDWSPIDTRINGASQDENREGAEGAYYDYVMNVYRGYGESVIAALASRLPAVRFPPDDADDEDDRLTSQTYSKISDLLDRHWQSKLMIFSALFAMWNQGLVCAYHYNKSDDKYGKVKLPIYGNSDPTCPDCGYTASASEEVDCPNCAAYPTVDENNEQKETPQLQIHTVLKGFDESLPKSRTMCEIFSPVFVKIPIYALTQETCGYINLNIDQPVHLLKNIFCYDKKTGKYDSELAQKIDASIGENEISERYARAPSQYNYIDPSGQRNLATLRRYWLKPYEFERLGDDKEEEKSYLYKNYPKGAYVCLVGPKTYIESRDECDDIHWTIGKAGISTYIHSDAMGKPLIPAQEMKNQLTNVTMETIDQGISDVFADPSVVNFDDFSSHEKRPGTTYPAKPKAGQRLGDSFYEGPKATLSKDVMSFTQLNQQDSQFLVAAFPSIYGGPQESSSRTASEYKMSNENALQRLSITWTYLNAWWAALKQKCCKLYVENVVEDERYTTKDAQGNYVNVWIRKADLLGKVGEVEPEGSETFPVSMAQKQTILMQLVQMGNEEINAAVFNPENAKIVFDTIGFSELKLPDDNQRIKQVRENQYMVARGTYIPVEPLIDDNTIHITVAKNYLVSNEGQDLKNTNTQAYNLIMQHIQDHMNQIMLNQQNAQVQQAPQPGVNPGQNAPGNGSNNNTQLPKAPVNPAAPIQ